MGQGLWLKFVALAYMRQDRARTLILNTLLRVKPGKASANKWNKLLPSYAYFWFGALAVHGVHTQLCHVAMDRLEVHYTTMANQSRPDEPDRESFHVPSLEAQRCSSGSDSRGNIVSPTLRQY